MRVPETRQMLHTIFLSLHIASAFASSPNVTHTDLIRRSANIQECLAAHNAKRALYPCGLAPLQWDTNLQSQAQTWANYLAANKLFQHSQMGNGENLYAMWSSGKVTDNGNCGDAVNAWFAERPYYTGVIGDGNFASYGHYTQLVWPSTTSVGCASAVTSDSTELVVVCEYSPPGNWYGQNDAPR